MIAGFKSNIYCKGVVGDGCGGDRYFIVENGVLVAYDEASQTTIELLHRIKHPLSIDKRGCIITIACKDEMIRYDLSKLEKIT